MPKRILPALFACLLLALPVRAQPPANGTVMDDLFTAQEWQAKGNLDAARRSVQDALRLDSGNVFAAIRMAQIDAVSGNLDRALDELAKVLKDNPDNLLALTWQGHVQLAKGLTPAAGESYARVLKLDPGNGWAWLGAAACLLDQGTGQADREAAQDLQKAQLHAGEDPDLHLALGDAFARLHLPTNARLELERSQELNPRGVRALELAGRVYLRMGMEGLALDAWRQALDLDRANVQAKDDILAVLGIQAARAQAAGNRDQAVLIWRDMLAYDPINQQALENLRRPK